MNILVIGGLGYLGSCVSTELINSRHNVEIIDCNLYKKWGKDEFHIPFNQLNLGSGGINKESFSQYNPDVILLCFSSSEDIFVSVKHTQKYHSNIMRSLSILGECFPESRVLQVYDLNASSKNSIPMYEHEMSIKFQTDVQLIGCPSLYGIAPAFDSSTEINNMIVQFIANKTCYLDGDPFEQVHFGNVNLLSKEIAKMVIDPDYKSDKNIVNCLPRLALANMINNMFGFDEYQLHVDITNCNYIVDYNITNTSQSYEDILSFKEEMNKGMLHRITNTLFEEIYNNKLQIENMMNAFKYKDFVVC